MRGQSYAQCGLSARRLLQGWRDRNYDAETKLIFRKVQGRRLRWDYHDVAADYYSSLVLIANYVAPQYIEPNAELWETLAMIRVAGERGAMYDECSRSTEALGNMLQVFSRLYVMSGEDRHLKAAEEIGDALLLDPANDTFRKMVQRRDSFRDHGCEMIPGLAELFVVECKLGSERAELYKTPLRTTLDQILETI